METDQKLAIVTGAGRGIGRAISLALGRAGVRVGLMARSEDQIAAVAAAINAEGGSAFHATCDLSLPDNISKAFHELQSDLKGLDILVNNAGMFIEKSVEDLEQDTWEKVLQVNLTAPFILTRLALPLLKARGGGRIINIASTASSQGYLNQSAYCASKHGLLGFARSLALETKKDNIHIHTLCPGGIDTELIKGTYLASRMEGQPTIRPEDIAELALFILKQPENIDMPEVIVRRFIPK